MSKIITLNFDSQFSFNIPVGDLCMFFFTWIIYAPR